MLESKHFSDIDMVEEVVLYDTAASFSIPFEDRANIYPVETLACLLIWKPIMLFAEVIVPNGDKLTNSPFEASIDIYGWIQKW